MRRVLMFGAAVGLALASSAAAQAQRPARRTQAVVVSAPAGTRVIRIPLNTAPTNAEVSPATGVLVGTAANSVNTLLHGTLPVPGLGFDFTHHALMNRNLDVRALIDPITQHRLALARQIRRETPLVPLALPIFFPSIQVMVQPQPPIVIIQQAAEAPPEEPVERGRPAEVGPREELPAEPPPELERLVLVRRDGTHIFAVAFVVQETRVVYVTAEGQRRTVALAALDLPETLRVNEERGTTLQLPI